MHTEDTTTKRSEGLNLQIKLSLPRNSNVWGLITQFRKEDALVHTKLHEAAIGVNHEAGRLSTKNREAKRDQLRSLVSNFYKVSPKDYLGHILGFYSFDIDNDE